MLKRLSDFDIPYNILYKLSENKQRIKEYRRSVQPISENVSSSSVNVIPNDMSSIEHNSN